MDDDLIICRCEEITGDEIKAAIREHDLKTMPEVKRLTRAGMGLCQGRTCGHLIVAILAHETGQVDSDIVPDTVRPPVRAVPIEALANWEQNDN